MTAMQEFVVPKSMPRIRLMLPSQQCLCLGSRISRYFLSARSLNKKALVFRRPEIEPKEANLSHISGGWDNRWHSDFG
jgi:hypothetical protein